MYDTINLIGVVVAGTMEPLQLEYEGNYNYDYVDDIEFNTNVRWRKAKAWGVPPNYFVLE